MSTLPRLGVCLIATLACVAPVSAEEIPAIPVPTAVVLAAPQASPQAIIAARAAETMATVAAMRTRLAEIVPMPQRNDAIAQSAADYAAHWESVIANYTNTQLQLVDSMIIGLNEQHQTQITNFLTTEPMVHVESLFADSRFTIPTEFPSDFTNPPLLSAGFFGS